jgi:hypothetical protein
MKDAICLDLAPLILRYYLGKNTFCAVPPHIDFELILPPMTIADLPGQRKVRLGYVHTQHCLALDAYSSETTS